MSEELRTKLEEAERAIFAMVKPAVPEPACWLDSDAGPSYCFHCAVKARGQEFELGAPIDPDKPSYYRTDMEDAFFQGIDGGYHGQSPHDNTERCYTCGKQLAYTLTDYGAGEEADYWLETELTAFTPSEAYALDRLFIAVSWNLNDDDSLKLARDVLTIAEQVIEFLAAREAA